MLIARKRTLSLLLIVMLALVLVPSALASNATLVMTHNPILGDILTDPEGNTLYRFTRDTVNVSSACYGQCATTWPPLLVAEGDPIAGTGVDGNLLGVLVRTDGTKQVMYNGMPLYRYANDKAAGDIQGQGVRAIWFIVKPNSTTVGNQPVAVHRTEHTTLGSILTDAQGRTLYTLARDQAGLSVCYDRCATNWPPLLVGTVTPTLGGGTPGALGMALRSDGNHQLTYNGKPLYRYASDAAPGDAKGQGVGNVWFVVRPAAP